MRHTVGMKQRIDRSTYVQYFQQSTYFQTEQIDWLAYVCKFTTFCK